jgi:hypothetical protein
MRMMLLVFLIAWNFGAFTGIPAGSPLFKPGAEFDYLILTPPDSGLLAQAVRFATQKEERGFKTRIAVTDTVIGKYGGRDGPMDIRNCIRQAWQVSGISWVLMIGDNKLLPARKVYSNLLGDYMFTDAYYACLEGEWDTDRDGIYGEETDTSFDLLPDVYLGRIPASSGEEAGIYIDKLFREQCEPETSDAAGQSLFLAQKIDNTINSPLDGNWLTDGVYYLHTQFKPIFEAPGSDLAEMPIREIYPDSLLPDGRWKLDSLSRPKSDYLNLLSAGYSAVLLLTHGTNSEFAVNPSGANETQFTFNDAMTVSSASPSHYFTISCNLMNLETDTSIAKALLFRPTGGAVSFTGSSGMDHLTTALGIFKRQFQQICAKQNPRPAVALATGLQEEFAAKFAKCIPNGANMDQSGCLHACMVHQFWGDPEISMRSARMTAADSILIQTAVSGDTLVVRTRPAKDSILVCASSGGKVLLRGFTRLGSAGLFPFDPSGENINITASKPDLLTTSLIYNEKIGVERNLPGITNAISILASPNPFSSQITIRTDIPGWPPSGNSVTLLDVSGKKVWTGTGRTAVIPGKNLRAGVYLVRIVSDRGSAAKRIILIK